MALTLWPPTRNCMFSAGMNMHILRGLCSSKASFLPPTIATVPTSTTAPSPNAAKPARLQPKPRGWLNQTTATTGVTPAMWHVLRPGVPRTRATAASPPRPLWRYKIS